MTQGFYAYTRVSTQKQGVKGVSLEEQRASIERYAERNSFVICRWFEERETAAKKGRPVFNTILKGLRRGEARGVLIHKIDRGARNLRDWADLGELIDAGVSVHFANESVDLQSRGGRLSADIQAVVASDFIRNLREETLKGMRGRLRQGFYPFYAPIGYVNSGGGVVKAVHPLHGPLMRDAFSFYGGGRYTLDRLANELYQKGLRTRFGTFADPETLSKALKNPFYAGITTLPSTGETFRGAHEPLVGMRLFREVQDRLDGHSHREMRVHDYLFRGLFRCALCGRSLVGERQKGRVYYRCHLTHCPTRTIREDVLEEALLASFGAVAPTEEWRLRLERALESTIALDLQTEHGRRALLSAQLATAKTRAEKLVNLLLDGTIDRTSFDERQRALIEERQELERSLAAGSPDSNASRAAFMEALELAQTAQLTYRLGNYEAKRELAILMSSNRTVAGKHVVVEPSFQMSIIKTRPNSDAGCPASETTRTAKALWEWAKSEVLRKQRKDSESTH